MTDPIEVLVVNRQPFSEHLLERLRAVSPRLRVRQHVAKTVDEVGDAWATAEALYTSGPLPTPELAPRLRWIQSQNAGVNRMLDAGPILEQVTLTSASGIHAPVMGQFVLLMLLAHAHGLPRMLEDQGKAYWPDQDKYEQHELRDATVGIVGYGSIGREVARLAVAFGMRVLAFKRAPDSTADTGYTVPGTGDPAGDLPERIYAFEDLPAMLGECDYVVLAAPLTPATRNLINAETLRAMKPGAFLVNVGRGGSVDEPALVEALQSGTIGGAGLDVFAKEPLPAGSPLWGMPNVIISPHVSGSTSRYDERVMALFAENLKRYVAGEELLNVIDVEQGY